MTERQLQKLKLIWFPASDDPMGFILYSAAVVGDDVVFCRDREGKYPTVTATGDAAGRYRPSSERKETGWGALATGNSKALSAENCRTILDRNVPPLIEATYGRPVGEDDSGGPFDGYADDSQLDDDPAGNGEAGTNEPDPSEPSEPATRTDTPWAQELRGKICE
jgi:hypothetical protein